ncbi:MAG: adenylosuccinate lyase [Deltaproteobacteria bacterium]|nr:adenylosuccinate lyase [Deltaproteobacteria bacterium]
MGSAVSPLDGRYRALMAPLRAHFSEFALMKARVAVEVHHALALDAVFGPLSEGEVSTALTVVESFDDEDYTAIKQLELTLRHDVKACEVFLRDKCGFPNPNRIHFGLTSEDVNNLAWSICVRDFVDTHQLVSWRALILDLCTLAERWADTPLPARTHGQHATPTTLGKELAVYVARLLPLWRELRGQRLDGKLNGATGNYAALVAAAPHVDWRAHERKLVEALGFVRNPATTQVEPGDSLARWLDLTRGAGNVLIDLCRDVWLYISHGYLKQRAVAGEVGSSTMPHKVNPIRFENAEGNLELARALCTFLADKLTQSRMQRDLSGSTVMRNLGVALGHHHLALHEIAKGLQGIDPDEALCRAELRAHPELLSEAAQTVLRTVRPDDVYTQLKALTRGRVFALADWHALLADLPEPVQQRLRPLTAETYVGDSARICREVVDGARSELAA